MNRVFEFSPPQLRVIVFLSALLFILFAGRLLYDYSRVDENSLRLSVSIAEPDNRYAPALKVDLNLSPADSLELLPGIGPALARRIVAMRETERFITPEDVMKVDGIGHATFAKIQPYIEVREW